LENGKESESANGKERSLDRRIEKKEHVREASLSKNGGRKVDAAVKSDKKRLNLRRKDRGYGSLSNAAGESWNGLLLGEPMRRT